MEPIRIDLDDDSINEIANQSFPRKDDLWNAHITKTNRIGDLLIAGCYSPRLDIYGENLIIIVTPYTSREDIIGNWGEIIERRERITAFFGDFGRRQLYVRQTVFRLHNDFRMSYSEIALFLNAEILVFLCLGLGLVNGTSEQQKQFMFDLFDDHLIAFGFSQYDVEEYREEAILAIKDKKCPRNFSGGPINSRMIREAIRGLSSKIEVQNISIDKRRDLLMFYILNGTERAYVYKLFLMSFPDDEHYINLHIAKWLKMFKMIVKDLAVNLKDYLLQLPSVGDLDQFFP